MLKRLDLAHELWRRGDLSWLIRPYQAAAYDLNKQSWNGGIVVTECTRKFGKSFLGLLDDTEFCIQHPGSVLACVGPIYKEMSLIITQLVAVLFATCPPNIRPVFRDGMLIFPREIGSVIYYAGTDSKHYEYLRGPTYHRARVDEAGFCDDLQLIVNDIFLPAMIRTSGGLALMSSTPISLSHDFVYFAERARQAGRYTMHTIDAVTDVSDAARNTMIEEMGGRESLSVRRELYCERVVDEATVIYPEFSLNEDAIVQSVPLPRWYKLVAGLDPGYKDGFGYVIGLWDFRNARCIVIGSVRGVRKNTAQMVDAIKLLEDTVCPLQDVQRYSDTDLMVIADLNNIYGVRIAPTDKKDRDAIIGRARSDMAKEKSGVIILPDNNKELLFEMRVGMWNKGRTDYNRLPDGTHCETLAAFSYMYRNLDKSNPRPEVSTWSDRVGWIEDANGVNELDKLAYNPE